MNDEARHPTPLEDPKLEEPTVEDRRLAALAKALGHPARVAILRTLARRGTCVCGEIVDVLPLAQSTVSQHLKVLRDAGLVTGTVEGPRSCYCLSASGVAALRGGFEALIQDLGESGACCR